MSGENLKLGKLMTHLQFSYILSKRISIWKRQVQTTNDEIFP
jgi:hypothetical protein